MTRFMQLLGALVVMLSTAALAETPFEFGQVTQGDVVEHAFRLENDSAQPLRIGSVQLAPSLQLARMPAVVPPHQGVTLEVKLDTSKLRGDYEGKVVVAIAGQDEREFTLKGRVLVPLEVLPLPAFFISTSRGTRKSAALEIVNRDASPVELSLAEWPDTLDVKLEPVEEGRRFRLTVDVPGDIPAGRQSQRIRIATTSPRKPELLVAVNTLVRDRVYTFPDNVDLGHLHRGELGANAQTLMVYQTGGDDFSVSAQSDIPGLDVRVERARGGDRAQLVVSLVPDKAKPGPIVGTLLLKTNDRDFPEVRVPVSGMILAD